MRMPMVHRGPAQARNTPKGFALIVTISLMVLLTVIAVGLLSLSAVSLRAASRDQASAEARANARMAVMLAIGELQRELGPDQRVNATASILSNADGSGPTAAPGRRHWVAAHDSWNSTSDAERPSLSFRRWLVSGPDSLTADENAALSASGQNLILWNGVAGDGSDRVSVPTVPLDAGAGLRNTGAFAWWVGDENSKALISRLPDDLGDPARVRADAQAAPATAHHWSVPLAGIDRESARLDRLASQRTVDLVVADPATTGAGLHDFTVVSQGVLTDVARGGLKRDLSLFLDHPVSRPVAPRLPNTRHLYPNGITWEELWLYHNVWRALEPPAAGLASMTGGDLSNALILMTAPGSGEDSLTGFRSDPFSLYKLPTYLRGQWLISLWARQKPNTEPAEYDLFYVSDGILTFWNPFDVPITLHPDAYMSFKLWSIPYTFEIQDENGVLNRTEFINAAAAGGGHIFTMLVGTAQNPHWGRTGDVDPVVLMPGEVLLMSENAGVGDPIPYASGNQQRTLGMKAGWNLGRGRSRPVSLNRPVTETSQLGFRVFPNARGVGPASNQIMVNLNVWYGADVRSNVPGAALQQGLRGRLLGQGDARNFPEVFPTLAGDFPSAPVMTGGGKHPFFLFSHQTKTEDSPTAWSIMHQARTYDSTIPELDPMTLAMSAHEIQVDALSGSQDSRMVQLSSNQINRGLFGGSYWDHGRGSDTVITHSIPREPPVSLGAFQHAVANGATARMGTGVLNPAIFSQNRPDISHAIANSYALPVMGPAQTRTDDFTDHSFHVNRMLWDSWFPSGIVQRQAPHHPVKKTARQAYEDFLADPSANPLPNRRMKATAAAVASGADALFAANGDARADAHELASSKLMVEGAFNVNSTSVEAWKALLGSMEDAFIPVATTANDPANAAPHRGPDVPVHALLTAFGTSADRNSAAFDAADLASAANAAQWRGYRKLSRSEITELAEELVAEIRRRGPFLSMADFINRRPSGDTESALRGALQAALDRTVNRTLFDASSRVGTAPSGVYPFPEAAQLPKSGSTPAHVRQADLLTSIGSQLTVRSDTFRIRAYGESTDANGNVLAREWCEVIVQRVPDYIDPADPPHAADAPSPDPEPRAVPALTSNANRKFGRRLEVRSFRWLPSGEIQQ